MGKYCKESIEKTLSFPMKFGAKQASSRLGAHAPSSATTKLDGKWQTLKFAYGLQDGGAGSVVFVVRGDRKELFRSEIIRDHVRRDAEVDVEGVKTLELITEDGGDGNRSDHSIWIEPILVR